MNTARIRATAPLHDEPAEPSSKTHGSLPTGRPVEILVDSGDWLQVRDLRSQIPTTGWLPRKALSFPLPEGIRRHSSMLRSLKVNDFLESGGTVGGRKSDRSPDSESEDSHAGAQETALEGLRRLLQTNQANWDAWIETVKQEGRQGIANLEEGLAMILGGRDVWVVRGDQLFPEPRQMATKYGLAWLNNKEILRWTGKVKRVEQEKYQLWYEVELFKNDKSVTGWYKGDLLEPYYQPGDSDDPDMATNRETIFDMAKPMLRLPADPEIEQARTEHQSGYQYIKIDKVIKDSTRKYNLCGEFCAAALSGLDVIPLLQDWLAHFKDAEQVLRGDEKTGYDVIKEMIALHNPARPRDVYLSDSDVYPPTPMRIRDLLEDGGKMMVVGVNIYTTDGRLIGAGGNGKTAAHWVVLEDVIPSGTGGWIRIYNPFRNREEVYSCDEYKKSATKWFSGLVVDVKPKP